MCVTVWVLRYKNKKKRGSGNNRVYRNLKVGEKGDLPSEARCQIDFVAREYGTLVPKGKTCAYVCKDGVMVMRKPGRNST